MIDFAPPPEVAELAERTRAFVREVCIPAEARHQGHDLDPALRAELQEAARRAGVFAPHVPREYGGHALDVRGWSVVFEEAGYSLLGPQALNCAAPDEGNMRLLEVTATPEQRERFLAPLARGEVRSCFAMTEPHPGAGSDPSALATTARRVDGGWVIDGEKRFISGADGAAFAICMARAPEGATMFFIDADNPGWQVGRRMPTTDTVFAGGHSEVALDRAGERELFGAPIEELGLAQGPIADAVIDLEASRGLIRWAAWAIDSGQPARHETSIAKVFVSEAAFRIVDRAVQLLGGDGVTHDLPVARFLNEVRPFRIYDGPSETHRWAIARRASRTRAAERGTL